jgi:hypothetical protein
MEQKPKKTGAIIATVLTSLICGCVALFACGFGVAGVAGVPITTTVNGYSTQQPMAIWLGVLLLCLSVIFIAVPVVVGVLTLRNKKPKGTPGEVLPPSEPLPPAS